MKPKLLLCLGLVLIGDSFGCASTRHTATKERVLENITFTVSLPGQNVAGSPIPMRLKLDNNRPEDIAIEWWQRSTSILIKDAEGGSISRTTRGEHAFIDPESESSTTGSTAAIRAADLGIVSPQPHGFLHPGRSCQTTINLDQYFHLPPGNYSLNVSTLVWVGAATGHGKSLKLQVVSVPLMIGTVH